MQDIWTDVIHLNFAVSPPHSLDLNIITCMMGYVYVLNNMLALAQEYEFEMVTVQGCLPQTVAILNHKFADMFEWQPRLRRAISTHPMPFLKSQRRCHSMQRTWKGGGLHECVNQCLNDEQCEPTCRNDELAMRACQYML